MDTDPKAIAAPDHSDPADWFAFKLRSLFDAVDAELPNALDTSQIDGIHDMRVATRRLRSALRDLEHFIGKHPAKAASKGFKSLADSLGSVRDEDVTIAAFTDLLSECDTDRVRSGIALKINSHTERRRRAFAELKKHLSVNFQQDLRHRFETSIEALLQELRHMAPARVGVVGGSVIESGLLELAGLGTSILDPFDRTSLHRARIATKRLRYSIDLFAECWGEPISEFPREFARMQGFLGDAHDRDTWIEDLFRSIRSRSRSQTDNDREINAASWMISEFIKERTKNYREAIALWSEWRTSGFADSLRTVVNA